MIPEALASTRDTLPPRDKRSPLGMHPAETSKAPPWGTPGAPPRTLGTLLDMDKDHNSRAPAQGYPVSLLSTLDCLSPQDLSSLLEMDTEQSSRASVIARPGVLSSSTQVKNPLFPQDLSTLKFGLIPSSLHSTLLDQEDYRSRTHAIEELKDLVRGFSPALAPSSSILGLLSFLCNLLDDSNFTVQHGSLEVLDLLVLNLGQSSEQYLQPVISATIKVLGDGKTVLRQEYMKTYMRLMKVVGPDKVLSFLLQNLKHKLSRVREEVVNITIAALLTHPSEDFNLSQLAHTIAPCLVDSKRKVRHAALEAFAVLASSMGPGKSSLLKAVDEVELQEDGDGVMNAVQARLARKTLPKLDAQGLVDYAIPLPSSAHGRGAHVLPGADTDWLMSVYRTQSARTPSGDHVPRRYGSHNDLLADPIFSARRVLSAGKGKNKLPWDNDAISAMGDRAKNAANAKELQQFRVLSDLQSPKLKATQGMPYNDDTSGIRKRASRISHMFQNSWDFNMDSLATGNGLMDHQPFIAGKHEHIGFSHTRGKSGSVDSELQFLGTNNHRQENASIFGSLNPSCKTDQPLSTATERTLSFPGSSTSQGSFILPSYPLSPPRTSPKQPSSSSASPKKPQDTIVAFSNSWPLKSFDGRPKPIRISSQKLGETAGENSQQTRSPLPLKPTLVKPPSSRVSLNGNKPFPPITRGASPLPEKAEIFPSRLEKESDICSREKDKKLSIDLSELNDTDHDEMVISLRSLRNSAAKKRAKLNGSTSDLESPDSLKLDLTPDSPSHASSPTQSPYSESGIYSLESLSSPLSPTGQGKRISDICAPAGSKSRPARVQSARRKGSNVREQSPSPVIMANEISSSDVGVIGQRMNYDNGAVDLEGVIQKEVSAGPLISHTKEPQRYPKPTKGFTGSTGSMMQINIHDPISTHPFPEDSVVIVGKGVFGSPPSPFLPYNQLGMSPMVNRDLCPVKQRIEPLSGVYGKAVHQNTPNGDALENHKDVEVNISKSARDKMRQKKEQSHKEHPEARDHEKNKDNKKQRLKHVEIEHVATESETSPGIRLRYKDRIPSSTFSPEIMDPSDFQPFPKPEFALSEALRFLADDDWEKKIEGLNYIRCLAAFHCDVLTAKLHDTNLAVVQEVKNLRSGVSRAAVVCLGDLFTHLKKSMDQELDCTVKCLLHKSSESNTFIREDVAKALHAMVFNVTPARALCSLLNGGQSHVHAAVRKCTAQHLTGVVERMGPGRILSGIKDVTDRILPAVAKFAQDTSPETRFYGRKMIYLLMSHPDFDKIIEKYVQSKDVPYIKESVNNLRLKGLGEMPLDTPSAKGRRSHHGSFRNMRSSSMSRDGLNVTERETGETARKLVPRNTLESADYVKALTTSLNAKDFRDRMEGIANLLLDCETNQDLVAANIVKIFDAFKSRLHDSNSKVNLMALETMQKVIPLVKDSLSAVINMLIPAIVDNNLNSKNPGIYSAASGVVQTLLEHIDSYLLLPIFCSKAQHLSGKAKQEMTEALADIVMDLYPRKPHAVEKKVVVVLWHLLGNLTNSGSLPGAGGNMRTATAKLSKALFAQMGESLLTHAASQPSHIKNILEEFLERST